MKRERFNQIQAGEKIIWRARARAGLTRGATYEVYGKTKENELVFKDDNHEFKMARAMDFAAGDWHLVSDEWFAGTKAGDRLMFRGYPEDGNECPGYLTMHKVYTALKDGDTLYVLDDQDDPEHITESDMLHGIWLNVGPERESVSPPKAYEDLRAGDVLLYDPKGLVRLSLTKGKEYVIDHLDRDGDPMIKCNNGDHALVTKSAYDAGSWVYVGGDGEPDLECRNVLPEDYWSLIDFALETGDKQWYDELMKKAKMPV